MQQEEWVDITSEVMGLQTKLKLLEVVKDEEISLEDCMQAQQINDEKMDPKFDICQQYTIGQMLKHKTVKLPEYLSYQEKVTIFEDVLRLQSAILRGQPSTSTIYSFSYLYDRQIYEKNYLMKALVQSINCFGNYLYELVKNSCGIKEDDINLSSFSFNKEHESNQTIIQLLLAAQKTLQTEQKSNKQNKDHIKALSTMLKFRRFLHFFIKSLGKTYEPKTVNKLLSDMQNAKKRLIAIEDMKLQGSEILLEGVFFKDIYKTLRCHYAPKNSKIPSLGQSLEDFKNIFNQLELFLPIPSKISEIKNRIEMLQARPYNALGKSFIKYSMFAKEEYIFSTLKTQDSLIQEINDWVHLKESIKIEEKFTKLISTGAPVVSQTLYRLLGNDLRWFWQCSKVYEDYNIIVHLANQVDEEISTSNNREMYICSWFYYYGVNMAIKQILTGFQTNIYQSHQCVYVMYVLQSFLNIFQRNSQIHLRKIDKIFLNNFLQGNFNKKMKKKMTQNARKMFADIQFKKGLSLYAKAMIRICTILRIRKLVPFPFSDSEQMRIKQRFRIFKHIKFTQIIEYPAYRKLLQEIEANEGQVLNNTIEILKEAKNIFQLFTQQFDQNDTYFRQKEEAQNLQKLSIKLSLVVMNLKMKTPNKKYSITCGVKYPEVNLE